MLIRITRHSNKPHTIKYIRDNGTETWMPADDFFVRHDLSHYALEKILGYRTAFNGMLNNGMGIKDFEDRTKRAQILVTDEATYAENMANLFLGETVQGEFPDFNAVQQETYAAMKTNYAAITLPVEKIKAIRSYLRELLQQWDSLPEGNSLELTFNL